MENRQIQTTDQEDEKLQTEEPQVDDVAVVQPPDGLEDLKLMECTKELAERFGVPTEKVQEVGEVITEFAIKIFQAAAKLPEAQGKTIEEPKPRAHKFSSQRTIEDATPAEKIVVDWLLKLDYSTKLACVILSGWHIGDHGTDGIVNDIIGQWTTEILDNMNAENLEKLSTEEAFMSGAVMELTVWEDNY